MTKAIGDFPATPLPIKMCQTNSDTVADVPRILSANTLTHYTHVTSEPQINAVTLMPEFMVSPSGAYGHDHSGGVFGKPFFKSQVTSCNKYFQGHGSEFKTKNQSVSTVTLKCEPSSSDKSYFNRFFVYINPCDEQDGAYNSLGFSAQLLTTYAINVNPSDTVKLTLENLSTGSRVTISKTGINVFGDILLYESTELINLVNGQVNELAFQAEIEATATSGNRSLTIQVIDFDLLLK